MSAFNGHNLNKGDTVRVTARHESPKDYIITHVCARFIHVGGKMFWKTSGTGANYEATGYKLEKIR